MINIVCFFLSALCYVSSTFAHLAQWVGGSQRGERLARPTLIAAVILHGVAILVRWVQAGFAPLSNGFEAFSFYAWGIGLVYLLVKPLRRFSVLGVFVTPLALASILIASGKVSFS